MSGDDSEEKSEEASERKLKKLRDDGIVSSSAIGSNYFGFATGVLVTILLMPLLLQRLQDSFSIAFELALNDEPIREDPLHFFLYQVYSPVGGVILAIIAAAVGFKVLSQQGFIFSLTHVQPNLNKVNPVEGLKNLFKGKALTEFAATFIRFCVLLIVCVIVAYIWAPVMLNLDLCVPFCAPSVSWSVVQTILIAAALLILAAIAFDLIVQKVFFLVEQRMTKTEVKQERKEMLGQPEVRQERRRLQRDMTQLAGTVGVSAATIYFNYGDRVVALIFDPIKAPLPKIAAKSREAANTIQMIRDLESRGVPGVEDEEIVSVCELIPNGNAIPRKVFEPVAAHLRSTFG